VRRSTICSRRRPRAGARALLARALNGNGGALQTVLRRKDGSRVEVLLAMRAAPGPGRVVAVCATELARARLPIRPGHPSRPPAALTPRQGEILKLIAEGYSTKEIARRLDLSVKTVETHRAQLMDRLDIHDVAGLVRYAIRIGVVSAEH
jgi:DNA-binding NarL/FixJ family response regulator